MISLIKAMQEAQKIKGNLMRGKRKYLNTFPIQTAGPNHALLLTFLSHDSISVINQWTPSIDAYLKKEQTWLKHRVLN